MDTSLVTTQFRKQQWKDIIQARMNSGQTVTSWCEENGVNIKSYYYWLRKIKAAMLEDGEGPTFSSFAELPAPQEVHANNDNQIFHPELTLLVDDVTVCVNSSTSGELLASVLQVIRNA